MLMLLISQSAAQQSSARWLFLKPFAYSMSMAGAGTGFVQNIFSAY